MKLLIVTPIFPPEIGGPATYTAQLLEKIPTSRAITFSAASKSPPNVAFVSTSGNTLTRQLNLFWQCLVVGRDCDIFYLQEPAVVGLAGLLAGKLLAKKIVTKYVGDPSWEEARRRGRTNLNLENHLRTTTGFLYKITRFVLTNSDRVITPARYLRELLIKNYHLNPTSVVVIPNSVNVEKVVVRKRKNSLIYVGRLVPWKNVDQIITALANVKFNFSLKIVGAGPLRASLENLTRHLNLESQVKFLGALSQKDTRDQIGRCEILILNSSYEGLPHVILEALASQTVVLASDIPGTREVLKHNFNGFLIKSSLRDSLVTLVSNTRLKEKLRKNGLATIIKSYTWEKNMTQLKKLFHEISPNS